MDNYYQHGLLFLKRFFLLLILYFVSRLFFLILNTGYFHGIHFSEILTAFIAGVRFDIAAVVFTNILFLIFLLPGSYKNNPKIQLIHTFLFFAVNAFALLSNFIDAKFFDFINKRSTSSIFTLLGTNKDVWLMIPQFIKDYWYVAASWIALMILFWYFMPRLNFERLTPEKLTLKSFVIQTLLFIGITGLMLLGARGTKLKPISLVDAANYTELKVVPLVLNTPFSILKTIENENLEELKFFSEDSVRKIYNPVHRSHADSSFRKLNVIIFILESFSKEYCGFLGGEKGYTPHLDSILGESLVFPNAFANGTQSYEAMPAIIAGIPSLMDRPYSGSNYADNIIESLPWLLGQEGYSTTFFHGGNNGTMGFKNFALVAGIDQYLGRDEYNNDTDFDGHWGIWDEPFLQFFEANLDKNPQPFFSAVFTLSSHHPYNVPLKYAGRFKEGKLPILKSIAYADFALGEFFKAARNKSWYRNTLFVFTADHAAQAVASIYNSTTGMFAIPIAFHCASDSLLKGSDSTICQQIDIMPTVLDYLNYDKDYFAFGESLLDPLCPHWSVSFVNGIYQYIEGNYVMQFDGNQVTSFYSRSSEARSDKLSQEAGDPHIQNIYSTMEIRLKAILQTYNNCLLHNKTRRTDKK